MSAGRRRTVPGPRRLIGIGNAGCGDDAVGPRTARRLRELCRQPGASRDLQIHECSDAADLCSRLDGCALAVLVDACYSGAAPGTVHRFAVGSAAPLPASAPAFPARRSSHSLGLPAALELARALGCLPARCFVFAIEGRAFAPGAPMSGPVTAASEALLPELIRLLGARPPGRSCASAP